MPIANTPLHHPGWALTRSQQQAPLRAVRQLLPRQLLHCEGGPAACRDRGRGYQTQPGRPRCHRGAAKDSSGDAEVAGPARTCQEGADTLHKGVRLAGRVLLQRLRGRVSGGPEAYPAPSAPAPPAPPSPPSRPPRGTPGAWRPHHPPPAARPGSPWWGCQTRPWAGPAASARPFHRPFRRGHGGTGRAVSPAASRDGPIPLLLRARRRRLVRAERE